MRKIRIILAIAALAAIQVSFADDDMTSDSQACSTIANACSTAGFARTDMQGKKFWQDCMKPILLGQTVTGVTIDAATAKQCRTDKIEELKKELKEFQKAK